MSELAKIIVCTLGAGLAMPLGAILARIEKLHPKWLEVEFRHSVIAFGGGALLSAVALVLVPDGIENLSMLSAALAFIAGGLAFMGLDYLLYKINTPASQLAAMLSDFVPESIALGAAFATGGRSGFLLAGLMALQNLPEGFNAFREMTQKKKSRVTPRKIILSFAMMALLGPISGLLGYLWLSNYPPAVGGVMVFAAGGILYSVFQDIAPQAKLEKHWSPPMGVVLGFLLGMLGHMAL